MSLIEEALRRARDPTLPETPATSEKPQSTKPQATQAHSWPVEASGPSQNPLNAAPNSNALVIVAVAVLGLTLVLIVGGAFWMGRTLSAPRPVAAVSPPSSVTAAPPPPVAVPATAPVMVPRVPHLPRPGPRPPVKGFGLAPPRPTLVLSGVAVAEVGASYAVINGKIVSVGEEVEGLTLSDIAPDTVKLRDRNGNETVLRVPR